MAGPAPHPEPPPHFDRHALPLLTLNPDPDDPWSRLYRCAQSSSLYFGQTRRYRFEDPEGVYGVLYVGRDVQCAFIETFGDTRSLTGELEIARGDVAQRCLALIGNVRPLHVVDLTGAGLAQIGADARLTAGGDYALTQRWGRKIFDHPQRPDGVLYRARHDQSRLSLAVFSRASSAVTESLQGSLFEPGNWGILTGILRTYRIALLP